MDLARIGKMRNAYKILYGIPDGQCFLTGGTRALRRMREKSAEMS
jgi:hypothetical protein